MSIMTLHWTPRFSPHELFRFEKARIGTGKPGIITKPQLLIIIVIVLLSVYRHIIHLKVSKMPKGSCFCGNVKIEYTGEPAVKVRNTHAPNTHIFAWLTNLKCLCHCADCRKIGGGNYSNNHIVPDPNFKLISGKPKPISKIADSGKEITSYFCPDCGTTLWRDGESFKDMKIIKAGILDDQEDIEKHPPVAELYGRQRVNWVKEVDTAEQKDGMGA
jgi:hypothetical protein